MNTLSMLFAMGIPNTTDDRGYFLMLPHLWSVFVIPILCFYVVLAAWVIGQVRSILAAPSEYSTEESAGKLENPS